MKYCKRIVVYAPSYDENVGGIIALHRLSQLLQESGYKCCLHPWSPQFSMSKPMFTIVQIVKYIYGSIVGRRYETLKQNYIPIIDAIDPESDVIVYPEIVIGNPLRARNVVRWVMYYPGKIMGKWGYGNDDLIFSYHDMFSRNHKYIHYGGELKIIFLQKSYYNSKSAKRSGTCYIKRKRKYRKIVHDLDNSKLIDGKAHEEIAEIFRNSEACISYDCYTMYSRYAAICGCLSIVVPEKGVSKLQWKPKEEDRWGIAYGFDEKEIKWALSTRHKVLPYLINHEEKCNAESTSNFISMCVKYFDLTR